MSKTILLTGGTGFIGSHTAIELLKNEYKIILIDNLSNSSIEVVKNIEKITNKKVLFYNIDMLDKIELSKVFSSHNIDYVVHFAGFKAVGESVKYPIKYYQNNLISTLNLIEIMDKYKQKKLIFSSSSTVYGITKKVPVTEDSILSTTNPYGYTKLVQENILRDIYNSDNSWNIVLLRYFNPVGADASGLIGEEPNGIPNNLFPIIMKVASKQMKELNIFGNDYDTLDGTCIRDYIHVTDVANGHLKAIQKIEKENGIFCYNLGTGKGASVLECVNAFSEVCGFKIPFVFKERRDGDVPSIYANPSKAKKELNWKAEKTLTDMCKDSWNFQQKNSK
jgi:UDP-glucose 4-epimerase